MFLAIIILPKNQVLPKHNLRGRLSEWLHANINDQTQTGANDSWLILRSNVMNIAKQCLLPEWLTGCWIVRQWFQISSHGSQARKSPTRLKASSAASHAKFLGFILLVHCHCCRAMSQSFLTLYDIMLCLCVAPFVCFPRAYVARETWVDWQTKELVW